MEVKSGHTYVLDAIFRRAQRIHDSGLDRTVKRIHARRDGFAMKKKTPKRPTHDPKPSMGERYMQEPGMMMSGKEMKKKMGTMRKRMGKKK